MSAKHSTIDILIKLCILISKIIFHLNLLILNTNVQWLWFNFIPFVLLLNIHFLNYYVPSRAYSRGSSFNHLDSASLESTFSYILSHNCHFYSHLSRVGQQGERRADPISVLRSPTVPPQIHRAPPQLPLIPFQGKIHAIDGYYWVITLIFKNMVIYPSVWRIIHYSHYPQFYKYFIYIYIKVYNLSRKTIG